MAKTVLGYVLLTGLTWGCLLSAPTASAIIIRDDLDYSMYVVGADWFPAQGALGVSVDGCGAGVCQRP